MIQIAQVILGSTLFSPTTILAANHSGIYILKRHWGAMVSSLSDLGAERRRMTSLPRANRNYVETFTEVEDTAENCARGNITSGNEMASRPCSQVHNIWAILMKTIPDWRYYFTNSPKNCWNYFTTRKWGVRNLLVGLYDEKEVSPPDARSSWLHASRRS
jgi:hypothetical protein